jgi:hypothetical protein
LREIVEPVDRPPGAPEPVAVRWVRPWYRPSVAWIVGAVTVVGIHWVMVVFAALTLAYGEGGLSASEGCPNQLDGNGRCTLAWGRWSPLMYSPELGLVLGGYLALAFRSPRGWRVGLGAAALGIFVVYGTLAATDAWSIWQMPVFLA